MEIISVIIVIGLAGLVSIVALSRLLGKAKARQQEAERDIRNYRRVEEALHEVLPEAEDIDGIRDLLDDR